MSNVSLADLPAARKTPLSENHGIDVRSSNANIIEKMIAAGQEMPSCPIALDIASGCLPKFAQRE